MGLCERCGLKADKKELKENGGVCNNCCWELFNEQEQNHVIVTHDMALDAGDLSLEGQNIK